MVPSMSKVHISYGAWGAGSGFRKRPLQQQPWGREAHSPLPRTSHWKLSHLKEKTASHTGLWVLEAIPMLFSLKKKQNKKTDPRSKRNRAPKRARPSAAGFSEEPKRNACVDRLYPQKEVRFPQASSGGLAPAECKDQSVFIFISEEIKKKTWE